MTSKNYQDDFFINHLQHKFRYNSFKEGQVEIIKAILEGKDALALFPTGSGKSLCYQFPATLLPSYTVVILPLIALMQDHLRALQNFGIKAKVISSEISSYEEINILKNLSEIKVLLISPERLKERLFLNALKKTPPSLFVVDEAHSISLWGRTFRSSYLGLDCLKKEFFNIPIVAMTATLTSLQESQVISALQLNSPVTIRGKVLSENQTLLVKKRDDQFLDEVFLKKGAGIVFTETKQEAERIYRLAKEKNLPSYIYHSSLSRECKEKNLNQFLMEKEGLMVATMALGQGIDKQDIRYIVHTSMPTSMTRYLQEIGRGGRDGKGVQSTLYYDLKDYSRGQYLAEIEFDGFVLNSMIQDLKNIYLYCKTKECRSIFINNYFSGEKSQLKCERCDNCSNKKSFWKRLFF